MGYTELDRFNDALKGHVRDRVPVYPLIGGWAVANFSDLSTDRVAADPRLFMEAQIKAREAMGYDPVYAYMDAVYIAEAFGCRVRYLETGTVVDPLDIQIKTPEDLADLSMPSVQTEARLPVVLETVRLLSEYGRGDIPVVPLFEGPFTTACRVAGTEQVMRMTYRHGQLLGRLLERMTDFLAEFGNRLAESGADILIIPEPTGSSSMISPGMFEKFVMPGLRRLTDRLKVPWILHMCGDTLLLLDLMARTGAAVLSLDQCMDLSRSRQKVPHAVIGGNVDPVKALLMGTPRQVTEDTLRCLRQGGDRFVLMSGCGIPPRAPRENVLAMIRAAAQGILS